MHTNVRISTARAIARGVIVASLVVGASLASAAAASAQARFQASISAVNPKPQPCPNGEFFCGTVNTNYGPAAGAGTDELKTGGAQVTGTYTQTS